MRRGSPSLSSSSSSSSSTSLPTSPSPPTTRFPNPASSQRWARPSGDSARRLSIPGLRSRSSSTGLHLNGGNFLQNLQDTGSRWLHRGVTIYETLSPVQRAMAFAAALVLGALVVLFLLYTEAFFAWLATVSKTWRQLPGGWLINFFLVMATSFPPIIGYSTANTIAGFVYGFPAGWPIAASASVVGSLAAFLACRTVLSNHVNRLIGNDPRFVALGQVLRQDGLLYLTAIRFCPLPFSLSNGFLATIPSISPSAFAISTAISTPKLLIHVFIGSQMATLAEKGDTMSLRDRLVNYASMALFGTLGAAVGYIIYRRTFARAAQMAQVSASSTDNNNNNNNTARSAEEGLAGAGGHYADLEESTTLMNPEDAANIMGDDDVSLWNTQMDDHGSGGGWGHPSGNGKK